MSDSTPSPPPLLPAESDAPSGFGAGWAERKTAEFEEDALIGVVLNETYHIARVIGEGGMGRVYEAWHTRISKKRYAIKVLHAEFARNEGILKRFQREAETAACLSHGNAVGVYDVGVTSDQRPFLVSEFLDGTDLAHLIKEQAPLSPGVVKHIGLQIAGALIEAHARGVVHRDLKPQNIFLLAAPNGQLPEHPIAKVLDFGLSRFLDDADSELTRSGMVMGTPSYMSPEQARGERADHRVDVYGLGAILYACVVGKPPFKSSSPQATVLAVMNEEAPRPSNHNPDVAPDLELVIQTAMAREPERRYQTMEEFCAALEGLPGDGRQVGPRVVAGPRSDAASLRSQLVGFWAFGVLFGLATAVAALCGAVNLRYGAWPISRGASGLLAMVVLAAFSAPVLSLIRSVRYQLWDNTPLVVQALASTRRVVSAGVFAYGATTGVLLLLNVGSSLHTRLDILGETTLKTFSGIGLVAFAAAAFAAAASGFREHLLSPGGWVDRAETAAQVRRRQLVSGPIVVAFAVLLGSSTVVAAHRWPLANFDVLHSELPAATAAATSPTTPTAAEVAANPVVTATATSAQSTLASPPAPALASENVPAPLALSDLDAGAGPEAEGVGEANNDALTAAISQGGDALARLAEQFPNDPQVLRALAMDHASRASGLEKAIDTFKRLFTVSPQAINDTDLQQIVLAVARSKGTAMHKAFDLMGYGMGHVGPDLLYKLALSDRDRRAQARAYLGRRKVREKFSPALDIAYEIQFALNCSSRVALLPRAAQFGDERALVVLAALASAPKTGCGKRKQQPCRAKCPDESTAFEQTVRSIAARLQRPAAPAVGNSQ
jgi:tRNA A-37 threonylcarbamoyl transferase component Bud32/MFS family permease